jgi:hypothetical protein
MDKYFREANDDVRTDPDATETVKQHIRKAFDHYAHHLSADSVVDKSPRNCFKIPFLLAVFPEAQFIHVIRDGRDAVLSIHKLWQERMSFLSTLHYSSFSKIIKQLALVKKRYFDRQVLMRHKLQSLHFEMGSWLNFNYKAFHNQIRWRGKFGWGPRFRNYERIFDNESTLVFNAYQWLESIKAVMVKKRI